MIYEREIYFTEKDYHNETYFPNILIVRKKKIDQSESNTVQNHLKNLKQIIKEQAMKNRKLIQFEAKEQKEHFTNQIRFMENEMGAISKDVASSR